MKNLIIALLVVLSIGFQEAYGQREDILFEVEYKNEAGDTWGGPQLYYRDLKDCTYKKVHSFPVVTCAEYPDQLYTGYRNNKTWFYFAYTDSVPTWFWYETKPVLLAHNGRWSSGNYYRYCRPTRPYVHRNYGIGWTSGYHGGYGGYGRSLNFGVNVGWGNQQWGGYSQPLFYGNSYWGGAYGGGSPYDYRTRPQYWGWAQNDWYYQPYRSSGMYFGWGW